jgi:hypothetical protein
MRVEDIDSLPDGMLKEQIKAKTKGPTGRSSKRNDFEHELQKEACKYMKLKYPKLKRRFFAIPNGGARNPVTGAKLKAEGVLAGVWDLFLAVPKGSYGGCWIETKWGNNTLTDTQKAFRKANKDYYYFFVYRDIDTFIEKIAYYLEGI